MERSAPPEKALLPEAMTQPLTSGAATTVSMIVSSSSITSGVMTFIVRSGMSQVASATPSGSVSKRKFVRFISRFLARFVFVVFEPKFCFTQFGANDFVPQCFV